MVHQKYRIRILLPLCNPNGRVFPASLFHAVKANLCVRFQNFSAYSRAAAEKLWPAGKKSATTDVIVCEMTIGSPDIKWLREYRHGLQKMFQQGSIVIHAQKIVLP